jgi:DNA-binding CsgD family transcriptional regulator
VVTLARSRVTVWRARDLDDHWEKRDSPSLSLSEVNEVLRAAQTILTTDVDSLFTTVSDITTAKTALSTVWQLTAQALHGNQSSAETITNLEDLLDLLNRVRAAEMRLAVSHPDRGWSAFETARRALVRLANAKSVPALISRALPAVCELGFDRAILSKVHGGFWVTQAMCIPEDPQWASEIVQVGQQPAQPLSSGLYEYEIVRRGIPMIVSDVQDSQHVHRRIAEASLARSYTGAPIAPHGQVIGLLHGDCYFQRRHVDKFDRDALGIFAMGFGYLLQRNKLWDQIQAVQADISRMGTEMWLDVNEAPRSDPLPPSSTEKVSRKPPGLAFRPDVTNEYPVGPDSSALTRRELEVLTLIAKGETNTQIAHRLVISEGTVKSHVKHILRKLNAANRAEAVSLYLQHFA